MVKNLPANEGNIGNMDLTPGSERFPGKGNGNQLQYSYLGNLMNKGDWPSIVHGVAKESDTTLRVNNNN